MAHLLTGDDKFRDGEMTFIRAITGLPGRM